MIHSCTDTSGSCVAAGYESCCMADLEDCFGFPPTCSCHSHCRVLGTCCSDIDVMCATVGSCEAAGFRACCWQSDCQGLSHNSECHCDHMCHVYNDCCPDKLDLCPTELGFEIGSCIAAGYTACCTESDLSECFGAPGNCKCDAECRDHGDCCYDVDITCPLVCELS